LKFRQQADITLRSQSSTTTITTVMMPNKSFKFYVLYDLITGEPLGVFNSDDDARTHISETTSRDSSWRCVEWFVQPVELRAPTQPTFPRQWIVLSKETKSWRRKLIDYLLGDPL
jgi:hypothetical protein